MNRAEYRWKPLDLYIRKLQSFPRDPHNFGFHLFYTCTVKIMIFNGYTHLRAARWSSLIRRHVRKINRIRLAMTARRCQVVIRI